jgi:hypothetical protein
MMMVERVAVAVMVGLSGAAVMAAINWGQNGGYDGPALLAGAFGGATIAGWLLAGKFGRRWRSAILASLTATCLGAALGAFLVLLRPEALMMGPIFVTGALLDAPLLLVFWAVSQLAVHVGACGLRRWMPGIS